MKGTVYKLSFPDGKFYIGYTIRSLKQRLWEHLKYANPQNKTKRELPVYLHWRKFDLHSVKIESIEELETDNINDLRYIEAEYIKCFQDDEDCLTQGYSYTTADEKKEWKQTYRHNNYERLKAYDTAWHKQKRMEK